MNISYVVKLFRLAYHPVCKLKVLLHMLIEMIEDQRIHCRVKETSNDMNEVEKVKFDSCKLTMKGEDGERKQYSLPTYSLDEDWIVNYIEQFGNEPSFF